MMSYFCINSNSKKRSSCKNAIALALLGDKGSMCMLLILSGLSANRGTFLVLLVEPCLACIWMRFISLVQRSPLPNQTSVMQT